MTLKKGTKSTLADIKCFLGSLPSSHGEVRDGVVVGLEDLGVVEDLVSERVEPVQGHSDVRGRHPVLQKTQQGRTVSSTCKHI